MRQRIEITTLPRDDLSGSMVSVIAQAGKQVWIRDTAASDVDTPIKLATWLFNEIGELPSDVPKLYGVKATKSGSTWTVEQVSTDDTRNAGRDDFDALPGWGSWTAEEATAWIQDNVTDLASAKVALKAMAKAIIYLRDMS